MNEGRRIALVGVLVSVVLASGKLLAGALSGSSALLADGFESTGDILASGLVWLGLTIAAKPADPDHPYGHGRAETLSGLIIGLLLLCGGLAIAIESLVNAPNTQRTPAAYAVWPLIISIAVKIWVVRRKWVIGRRIGSAALVADSMNDAVDVLSGVVALSALALTLFDPIHFLRFDRYGASAVGLIMVITGVRVARRSGNELMDAMPDGTFLARIREVALEVPGVDGVEKVYARKTGLLHHVDLHLEVDPEMTVRRSHELGHEVKRVLLEANKGIADVLVHIEPSGARLDGRPRYNPSASTRR